jgi:2'-5' RNA ligase
MRLFVAIDIPDAVRSAIAAIGRRLGKLCPAARWVRIEGAHVTLKFIGETEPQRAKLIRSALHNVRGDAPIEVQFAGLGFFPTPHRPRVLFAGVVANSALRQLAASIETALEPLGIPRESREFSPHITLARIASPKGLDALRSTVEKDCAQEFGRASVREFHLYQSVLKPGGAEYTRLDSFQISGETAA